MGYWVWRPYVHVETPFFAGSAKSYVTRDTMRTMSSITPASWLQVGTYFFPALYSSMDPCFFLVQGKIIQILRSRNNIFILVS
ncbi:hypothetical protein ALC56_02101 [Trachymyrmex septentrionalis]|uniref:Uncharacterized protein n=1 Tax=Trachymyrmex septentrionalis TaxID=34720 RepID=A0A195FRZ1_9HYME|nr:hypothetical protein ALC56_02101 [Trachymyrmex septentrionalis]